MNRDVQILQMAFAEAAKGLGETDPNPAVGAVITTAEGKVLSCGFHRKAGLAHAEIEALAALNGLAPGMTVYVSLEPCCHLDKRTPPCTEALIRARVVRVVYGYADPNPKVAGLGAKALRDAGIQTDFLNLAQAGSFYEPYTKWTLQSLPTTVAKLAISADGFVAGPNRMRVQISGPQAGAFTQEQRRVSGAILSTVETVIQDDPLFTVRVGEKSSAKPVFILDRNLNLPASAKVLQSAKSLTLFTARPGVVSGAETALCPEVEGHLDWAWIEKELGRRGYHRVWMEAGPRFTEAALLAGKVSQVYLYRCAKVLGEGVRAFSQDESQVLKKYRRIDVISLGQDQAELWQRET